MVQTGSGWSHPRADGSVRFYKTRAPRSSRALTHQLFPRARTHREHRQNRTAPEAHRARPPALPAAPDPRPVRSQSGPSPVPSAAHAAQRWRHGRTRRTCYSAAKRLGKNARGPSKGEANLKRTRSERLYQRMCRIMKRSDAEWKRSDAELKRSDAERKRWFRSGKGRGKAVKRARRWTPSVPRRPVALRPVNVHGNRAKGMRAPENTNQFLMTEKYRLHALRSDSVDSGSDASSDAELTDMDSYLRAWENAHGALLDADSAEETRLNPDVNEDSLQYFPSEDDLNQSDNFMHRDFAEFCRDVTA